MKKASILSESEKIRSRLVKIRRDIHRHPELGYEERRSAGLAAGILKGLGLEVKRGVAKTGLVGLLRGRQPGKTIAIRADMDALPVQEEKKTSYASRREGIMHSCGHDAHMAIALGAAMLLSAERHKLRGNVKFIFQPNEEIPPGGAKVMIEEGVLANPRVQAIVALHVNPSLQVGEIGIKAGPVMSSVDSLTITIKGQAAHAALPHLSVDAIAVAAQVIQGLQHLVSRQTDPLKGVVVSIGLIEGGRSLNIVADRVTLRGTVRTLDASLRDSLPGMIGEIVKGICKAMGARYKLDYDFGNPMVVNDEKISDLARGVGRDLVGADRVVDVEPSLMGEDFAYFLDRIPGCLIHLGVRNERRGIIYPLHHPRFDLDEDVLPLGAALFAETAMRYLSDSE